MASGWKRRAAREPGDGKRRMAQVPSASRGLGEGGPPEVSGEPNKLQPKQNTQRN